MTSAVEEIREALEVWRPARGQAVIREIKQKYSIFTPDSNPRSVKTHKGEVVALGPPALIYGRIEVPWGFDVGAVVQYHFIHNEAAHTRVWPPTGVTATWVPQSCIDFVWDTQ